jgi:four helix bundle protein
VGIIRVVDELPNTRTGNHVAGQLLRSGTSPSPNHAEAQSAESPGDFIHKMRICLKEVGMETEELIKIFVRSVHTAETRKRG